MGAKEAVKTQGEHTEGSIHGTKKRVHVGGGRQPLQHFYTYKKKKEKKKEDVVSVVQSGQKQVFRNNGDRKKGKLGNRTNIFLKQKESERKNKSGLSRKHTSIALLNGAEMTMYPVP